MNPKKLQGAERRTWIVEQAKIRTLQAVADDIGVTRERIRQIVVRSGIEREKRVRRMQLPSPAKQKKIIAYALKHSVRLAAEKFDLSRNKVDRILQENEITLGNSNARHSDERYAREMPVMIKYINDYGVFAAKEKFNTSNQVLKRRVIEAGYCWEKQGRHVRVRFRHKGAVKV